MINFTRLKSHWSTVIRTNVFMLLSMHRNSIGRVLIEEARWWLEELACLKWNRFAVAFDKEQHQDEVAAL